jgi:hypothetical protein
MPACRLLAEVLEPCMLAASRSWRPMQACLQLPSNSSMITTTTNTTIITAMVMDVGMGM